MQRRRRTLLTASALAAALSTLLGGCAGATSDPTANSGTAGPGGPVRIGVTIHQADVYFQGVANAVDSAVTSAGGSSTLVNTRTDAAAEASGIQNLIASKVSGIVASPLSPTGSLASLQAAHSAGIPIVCYNTCLGPESEKYAAAFIESDQLDLGTKTGTFAAAELKKRGIGTAVLGMVNCNRYEACQSRQKGFLDALAANGITVETANDQEALAPDTATAVATNILTANPKINVMWASSQGATEGLVAAVKAAGRKDVALFGTDVSASLVRSIKNGDLLGITGQDSAETGRLAVQDIEKAIAKQPITPFSTRIPGILYSPQDPAGLDAYLKNNA